MNSETASDAFHTVLTFNDIQEKYEEHKANFEGAFLAH